ncbi:MAG: UTRA domain-containing protein [Sutterella sp.]
MSAEDQAYISQFVCEQGFNRQLSTFADLDRLASANRRRILDIREILVSKELAARIFCPPGETLIRFSMVRLGSRPGEPPIARTTEYVRREWQALVKEVPKHPDRLMIDIIASVFGKRCAEIRQSVEASLLSEEAARQLSADPGTPCLRILRRYLTERGELLLTTVSVHPASRYAFSLNVKLDAEDRIS